MYMKCYIGKGIRDGLDNAENRSVRWARGSTACEWEECCEKE